MRIIGSHFNIQHPSIERIGIGVEGSSSQSSFYDTSINTIQLPSYHYKYKVNPNAGLVNDSDFSFTNLTPNACTVSGDEYTRTSAGYASLQINYKHHSQFVSLDFTDKNGGEQREILGYRNGSHGKFAWDILKPLLDSKPSNNIFANNDISSFRTTEYNSDSWVSGFDFSGVTCWNSLNNTSEMVGTLITRRHLLLVNHFTPNIGSQVAFKAKNGTVHTRTIIGFAEGWKGASSGQFPDNPLLFDESVAVLDSDVHTDIVHYPVIGDWIYQSSNAPNAIKYAPAFIGIKLNRAREARLAGQCSPFDYSFQNATGTYLGQSFVRKSKGIETHFNPSVDVSHFLNSYQNRLTTSVVGDSGSPFFIPLSTSTLALAGCVSTAGGSCGFPQKNLLDAMIASADINAGVATGYTVTEAPSPV